MMARIRSLSVERANVSDCLRGAYTISKPQIVYALCTKLSWSVKDFRFRQRFHYRNKGVTTHLQQWSTGSSHLAARRKEALRQVIRYAFVVSQRIRHAMIEKRIANSLWIVRSRIV
jgi:hypothetical protein